jgi:3-oxoacyl-[acyl-carrier-protein] synthase III
MNSSPNTIIESMGVYHPPDETTTSSILDGCKNPIRFPLEKITGIKTRRMAGQKEFSIDLAKKAIADCLEISKYQPGDIDLLICCNISRYDHPKKVSFEPCTAIKLKAHLGFENAVAYDISNACAGMFTGIYVVDALLKSGAIRRGMVVSGEYITHLTLTAQEEIEGFMDPKIACLTVGDSGIALILEKGTDNHSGFQEIDIQTFGRFSPFCIAKESDTGGWIMHTDAVNLSDAAIKTGGKYALDILRRTALAPEMFQYLIMHQTSRLTLDSARREINQLLDRNIFHNDNTVNNLEHRGNTATTSHFVAVADLIQNKQIHAGDKVIFSISASGLTVGTALYEFDDLPDRVRQKTAPVVSPETTHYSKNTYSDLSGKTSGIRIESIGILPENVLDNKDSLALLHQAASDCIERSAYNGNDIGLLISTGVYRSEYILEPAIAALLAGKLDMNAIYSGDIDKKTLAFDVFNGSMGFLNACHIAQQMIEVGKCRTAMVVASEIENNTVAFPDQLIGVRETASAIILDAHPDSEKGFSRIYFHYDSNSLNAYSTYSISRDSQQFLYVEKDAGLEEKYLTCLESLVDKILLSEELNLHQIDLIIPPQISTRFIEQLSKRLDVPIERFVNTVGDSPDLFSSSLSYGLANAYDKGLVKNGDTGLLLAIGSGLQAGGTIYKF